LWARVDLVRSLVGLRGVIQQSNLLTKFVALVNNNKIANNLGYRWWLHPRRDRVSSAEAQFASFNFPNALIWEVCQWPAAQGNAGIYSDPIFPHFSLTPFFLAQTKPMPLAK
jgi:hypothetical protein